MSEHLQVYTYPSVFTEHATGDLLAIYDTPDEPGADCPITITRGHAAAPSPSAAHAALLAEAESVTVGWRCAACDAPDETRGLEHTQRCLIRRLAAALRAASPSPVAVEADAIEQASYDAWMDCLEHARERCEHEAPNECWEDYYAARRGAEGGTT